MYVRGAVTLGAVTLGAVTLGAVTRGAVNVRGTMCGVDRTAAI